MYLLGVSRVGAVAHYNVLRAVLRKNRKWPFSAPHRIKILDRSILKFAQLIYVIKISKYAKFGKDRLSGHVSPYG
jgi:hypothetical protein